MECAKCLMLAPCVVVAGGVMKTFLCPDCLCHVNVSS